MDWLQAISLTYKAHLYKDAHIGQPKKFCAKVETKGDDAFSAMSPKLRNYIPFTISITTFVFLTFVNWLLTALYL